ncbi:DNA polymerase IV [Metamycoplasma phocicerebrale]|uniref:DNA polymerase IV n=1 Tax=Metamycoplasma phocicerebrale TaxID=142649 RepID=A0A3Q9VBH9_9BACT|nr:DNA polymerase IV [Metamycoplasma phocicerebrale]AZZ65466.1 DNA polymerase IV [Metamycoplasma phocicerebrale]
MAKIIFHIDMDAFFVSCERAKNNSLINKPIVIASNLKRAIISAASYEVKNLGFKTGDPFYKVKKVIKDLVIIEPHYDLYSMMSTKIFEFIENNFSKDLEIYSIDECYIDVTQKYKKYGSPENMAKEIQKSILLHFQIPCSIGISYTKFLAKMSTNKAKTFGIVETKKEDIPSYFYNLPINKIFGIGRANAPKLNNAGIYTYEDLLNCKNDVLLRKIFGKNYYYLIGDLKGENEKNQHVLSKTVKSISNSETFMINDSNNYLFVINELKKIINNIVNRANDLNLECKEISISLRTQEKNWLKKSKTLPNWTNDFEVLWQYALNLFNTLWNDEYIRGVGGSLSYLKSIFDNNKTINLFEQEKLSKIDRIINNSNYRFGKNLLKTGAQYLKEKSAQQENIKFLRKNKKPYNKKINLEE